MQLSKFFLVKILLTITTLSIATAQPPDRIEVQEQEIFKSGSNVAWVNFARDIGPGQTDLDTFEDIFRDVNEDGGNTMRLWLHTNGTNTPEWNGDTVVGPGEGTIEDLRDILDLAQLHDVNLMLCLWSFDMLQSDAQTGLDQQQRDRNRAILEDDEKMQAYIDNALKPMVEELKGHPAIGSWEIFNEPEGMSSEISNANWAYESTSIEHVQTFINRTAGTIKRADPEVKVTNGSWNFQVLSDIGDFHNYYRDDRLINAGGDEDGTLDFYTVHFYPEHFGTDTSPFHNDADHWGLDKPIVVAEFWPDETHGVSADELYTTLYERGYAGALSWSWSDQNQGNWDMSLTNMEAVRDLDPDAVFFSITDEVRASISANPERILEGGEALLKWQTAGADEAYLDDEAVGLRGSKTVSPQDTTEYKLVALADSGEKADTVYARVYIVPPDEFNRARGKSAFSSSNEQGHNEDPNYATDGDMNTRWSSKYTDDEWIYVDLEQNLNIDRVTLHWEYAYGEQYDIEVSHDGVKWHTVYEERNGDGETDQIDLEDEVIGRYVRMKGIQRGTQYGYSLWELEVFGTPSDVNPPVVNMIMPEPDRNFDKGDDIYVEAVVDTGTYEIDQVEILVDDQAVTRLTEAPFSFRWSTEELGDFSISARAADEEFEVYAEPVSVTVIEPPEITRYEAQNAGLSGDYEIQSDETASGGEYAAIGSGDATIRWQDIHVEESKEYDLRIGYRLPKEDQKMDVRIGLFVNRQDVPFKGPKDQWLTTDLNNIYLNSGDNDIRITTGTGNVHIDYIDVRGEGQLVSSESEPDIPDSFKLSQNYPNPFNPTTLISYELPSESRVTLEVFDATGRRVATLVDKNKQAGKHETEFQATDLSSGVYIYRLEADNFTQTRSMMLVK